jgi:putative peptidoglycan lipid II flippase
LLFWFLRKHGIYAPQPGWPAFLLKIALAVIAMAAALWFAMGPAADWLRAGWQWRTGMLAGLVLLGVAVYGGSLYAFGLRPRQFLMRGAP